ncbi:MAG: hypothetical protein O3A01_04455 [bacterium]|nr:hypothetical protein [bacterium]
MGGGLGAGAPQSPKAAAAFRVPGNEVVINLHAVKLKVAAALTDLLKGPTPEDAEVASILGGVAQGVLGLDIAAGGDAAFQALFGPTVSQKSVMGQANLSSDLRDATPVMPADSYDVAGKALQFDATHMPNYHFQLKQGARIVGLDDERVEIDQKPLPSIRLYGGGHTEIDGELMLRIEVITGEHQHLEAYARPRIYCPVRFAVNRNLRRSLAECFIWCAIWNW